MTAYETAALAAMEARFRWYAAGERLPPETPITACWDLPERAEMFRLEKEARALWTPPEERT